MRKSKAFFAIAVLVVALGVILAGCASEEPAGTYSSGQQDAGQDAQGTAQAAGFTEYPIGEEQQAEGMNIAAVYFQPVQMEPAMKAGLGPDEADIHLEADIAALKNNPFGFGFGEFVPYLTVDYKLKNLDSGEEQEGSLMPMNASDGPHYGANVKMMGAGKYKLTFIIQSPEKQDYLLHTDKETGVEGRFWKKPIEVEYEFNYLPREW